MRGRIRAVEGSHPSPAGRLRGLRGPGAPVLPAHPGIQGARAEIGYQFGGETSSGPLQAGTAGNWRCFKVARLSAVRLIESEGWHTGPAHSQTQRCIDIIDVDVERPELDGRSPPD